MSAYKILCIDGGGARGIIPAIVCREIERRAGKPIHKLFHRVCGTSTGSILATGLSVADPDDRRKAKFTAAEIVDIYLELGPVVFSRGSLRERLIDPLNDLVEHDALWWGTHLNKVIENVKSIREALVGPLHDVDKLGWLLHQKLGNAKLSDSLTDLFVYAYDVEARAAQALGSRASAFPGFRDHSAYRMWQAATASSAATPFFAPFRAFATPNEPTRTVVAGMSMYHPPTGTGESHTLIDGGCGGLGNPSLLAYLEPRHTDVEGSTMLVSLGTGHTQSPVGATQAIATPSRTDTAYNVLRGWGIVEWMASPGALLDCVFDGESDATDSALRALLPQGEKYFRFQPTLAEELEFLDEGGAAGMDALRAYGEQVITEHDEEIDAIVATCLEPDMVRVGWRGSSPFYRQRDISPATFLGDTFPKRKTSGARVRPRSR